jgi:hypothetical protein
MRVSRLRQWGLMVLMAVSLTSATMTARPAVAADHACCPAAVRAVSHACAPAGVPARCCVVGRTSPASPLAAPVVSQTLLRATPAASMPGWSQPPCATVAAAPAWAGPPAGPMPVLQRTSVLLI